MALDAKTYIARHSSLLSAADKRYIEAFGPPREFHEGAARNPYTPGVRIADAGAASYDRQIGGMRSVPRTRPKRRASPSGVDGMTRHKTDEERRANVEAVRRHRAANPEHYRMKWREQKRKWRARTGKH